MQLNEVAGPSALVEVNDLTDVEVLDHSGECHSE
mgnify:CR=1 FL=1